MFGRPEFGVPQASPAAPPPRESLPAPPPRDTHVIEAVPPRGVNPPGPGGPGPRVVGGLTEHDTRYWEEVDHLFRSTIRRADGAFRTVLAINIVIVAVGVALVASSIAYSWARGVDVLSTGLAAVGVANFVLVFFVGPQNYIEEAVRNLTRVQVIYRTYLLELESISDYDWYRDQAGNRGISDVRATVAEWERITEKALAQLDRAPQLHPLESGGSTPTGTPARGKTPAKPPSQ